MGNPILFAETATGYLKAALAKWDSAARQIGCYSGNLRLVGVRGGCERAIFE